MTPEERALIQAQAARIVALGPNASPESMAAEIKRVRAEQAEAKQVEAIAGLIMAAIKLGYLSIEEARSIVDGKARLTDFMHRWAVSSSDGHDRDIHGPADADDEDSA
jgi:hypothetical protein